MDSTVAKIKERETNGASLWRISSTLFGHIASDCVLEPIGKFRDESTLSKYPPTKAGDYVSQELATIKLAKSM
jgi:hypothetical protein